MRRRTVKVGVNDRSAAKTGRPAAATKNTALADVQPFASIEAKGCTLRDMPMVFFGGLGSGLNTRAESITLLPMGKTKISGTGKGYLGEIMVHRITGTVGIVENVVEATAGWPPEITLKLPDGSVKKGKLSDSREPRDAERKKIQPPQP